jgi:TonB family protein
MNGNELLAALPVAALSQYCMQRLDGLSISLIEHAARAAPPGLSQRLREEWLADLASRAARTSRLRLAVGCWWAAQVIAREHAVPRLATVGSSEAVVYAPQSPKFFSRRAAALLLIACLHLTLIYLLSLGMEHKPVQAVLAPITVDVHEEARPHAPPLPPVSPTLSHSVIDVIEPDISIEGSTDGNGLSKPVQAPPAPYSPPLPRRVERVSGGPGAGFPNTADYYPDASRRLGEKGVASVRVCVDATGRLTSDPSIAESSGHPRLDSGALTLARAGSGHYRPTLEDGRAVSACFPFRIRFEFRD